MELTHISTFTGIGGIDLGFEWAGFTSIATCENKKFPAKIIKKRFPNAEHHGDIFTTDFTKYAGRVTVFSGGFPCQPFSIAGLRKGENDDRFLWPQMLRAIGESQPSWVVAENVLGITSMVKPESYLEVEGEKGRVRYFQKILPEIIQSLKNLGYSFPESYGGLPIVLSIPAASVGAPHIRQRIFIVAHKNANGLADGRMQAAWSKWFDRNPGTAGQVWDVANYDRINGNLSGFHPERLPQFESSEVFGGNASNTICAGRSKGEQEHEPELHHSDDKERRADADANMPGQEELHASTEPTKPRFDSGLPLTAWREWPSQSPVCGRDDGIPNRVDRLEALGNAVVPQIPYIIGSFIREIELMLREEGDK